MEIQALQTPARPALPSVRCYAKRMECASLLALLLGREWPLRSRPRAGSSHHSEIGSKRPHSKRWRVLPALPAKPPLDVGCRTAQTRLRAEETRHSARADALAGQEGCLPYVGARRASLGF